MKRKYILCIMGLSVLLLSGCAEKESQMSNFKTEEEGTESALNTEIADSIESNGDSEITDHTGNDSNADEKMLTSEEAEAKALAHAGLMSDQVTFVKSKLDSEDGHSVYDVEFYSEDKKEAAKDISEFKVDYDDGHTEYEGKIVYSGTEYEFEIDAYSGTFRNWEAARPMLGSLLIKKRRNTEIPRRAAKKRLQDTEYFRIPH